MKIFKTICIILLYCLTFCGYLIISGLLNFNVNMILESILIIVLFVIILIQGIRLFKNLRGSNKRINLTTFILNIIVLFITFLTMSVLKDFYKIEDKSIPLYAVISKTEAETEEYNSRFKILNYKNNRISYVEEQEPIIDLIKEYIDEAENKNKNIFGEVNTSTLNIKLDYDIETFHKRLDNNKAGGYYIVNANSMYMNVEDPYKNVLVNYDVKYNFDFKAAFLHEYTHHVVYQFMKENNIEASKVPLWFIEGMSEYVGNDEEVIYGLKEVINFDKLNSHEDWNKNKEKAPVYNQSDYAITKLINENGKDTIKDILLNIKYMNFEEAFKKATDISFEKFKKEFEYDFKNSFEKYNLSKKSKKDSIDNTNTKIKCYEKYLKKKKNNINAYIILSNSYKNYDKSIETLKIGIKNNPKSEELWRNIAITYEEIGEYDLANEAYKKEKELSKK